MDTDARIIRAETALAAYRAIPGVDLDCAPQDLISDLLHLVEHSEGDAEGTVRRAVMNYEAERDEDALAAD